MASLDRNLRRNLENAVKKARRTAEAGSRQVLDQLAVANHEPWPTLTPEQRTLRNRLRAHGRQLGDRRDERKGTQGIERLTLECAYEQWHRLLFARFLAESHLLVEPESAMALSLEECRELAREQNKDWLVLASEFAQRMLPQIFRAGDPVLEIALPPEKRQELEEILEGLPRDVFIADDSLGWVYQFWQADEKDAVNARGERISADDLPAVTQLFTEDYMVWFLLHNTLGAWWARKQLTAHPELARTATSEEELRRACSLPGYEWTYLRFVRDVDGLWRPAAGTYDRWPGEAKGLRVLDPCMGSGHFLVFALPILAAMRQLEDTPSPAEAIDAVLRENLFGLELDLRCTQLAAFNLALCAWKLSGYRALPPMNVACSGLTPGMSKAEWLQLAQKAAQRLPEGPKRELFENDDNLFSQAAKDGMETLYNLFALAPLLGSLIDPSRVEGSLYHASYADLEPIFKAMLATQGNDDMREAAVAAQGMATATEILAAEFTLVVTNVPYLGRRRQDPILTQYCDKNYQDEKGDLATCFVARGIQFARRTGTIAVVTPQNWWFLGSFKTMRAKLLSRVALNGLVTLGEEAWQSFGNRGPLAALLIASVANEHEPSDLDARVAMGIDALPSPTIPDKISTLLSGPVYLYNQRDQRTNPDQRLTVDIAASGNLLQDYAVAHHGMTTGDADRMQRCFWEASAIAKEWIPFCGAPNVSTLYTARSRVLYWNSGDGPINELPGARKDGQAAWGRPGVLVRQMRELNVTLSCGDAFDINTAAIVPNRADLLDAIWLFMCSDEYRAAVRRIDRKVNVTSATLVKVPFDVTYWQRQAALKLADGLPKPQSSDPTQWLFAGDPSCSNSPLLVAVARLVGYRWPRQTGSSFMDCPAVGLDDLESYADENGIVCLPSLRGEPPAAERLKGLLAAAFGSEWSPQKLNALVTGVGFAGKTLDEWLRDGFFEQHSAFFHNRPFVWHVWDGRKDGFSALVNYHRLVGAAGEGRRTLEKLAHTYLGDWLDRQRADQKAGVEGADGRVAAAEHLRKELERILEGEPPYDLFVRWKPLHRQPVGWEPDINDGVRLNLRPFMTARPLEAKAKTACILRTTPKSVKWEKDRGREPARERADFPWFWNWDQETLDFMGGSTFDGNRWNNLHYSRAAKLVARERARGGKR